MKKAEHQEDLLSSVKPSTAMIRLAVPATLALLAEHEARCRRLIDILLHGVLR